MELDKSKVAGKIKIPALIGISRKEIVQIENQLLKRLSIE